VAFLHRLQELRTEIRALTDERGHLQTQIEADVEKQNSDQEQPVLCYPCVLQRDCRRRDRPQGAAERIAQQEGHLEFKAEILDESGNATSADLGHTYRKLLCIAFDLAVLRAHIEDKFPRFVYHDGVFESLDDRKKENLLTVIRRYADLGLQPTITLIDSDLPVRAADDEPVFSPDEIVITLHDEGDEGRLFKMKAW
jgi:uncharacterized protein YydD (DUF2326 family)